MRARGILAIACQAAWGLALSAGCSTTPGAAPSVLSAEDWAYLDGLATAVVEASRVRPGERVGAIGPNVTGGTVIRPGGRQSYPAFWIRDYAMSLDSGKVTLEEQRHMLRLTAAHQRDTHWDLPSGSTAPPGYVPDHVSFGNKPIYYPGTLEDYEGQGGEQWGKLPCLDDQFYFVHMAAAYVEASGDMALLDEPVNGKTLLTRLEEAFAAPPSHPGNHIVYAQPDGRGVTFGFVDTVVHTGDLLFCSLLKYRAALELAALFSARNDSAKADEYRATALALRAALTGAFATADGMLRASTGSSRQPDVWGTAFAVYIGALEGAPRERACRALAEALRNGTIAWRGQIRHVRTTDDFSRETAWEIAYAQKNRYQNGAYWGTPTGWVCYAAAQVDPPAAQALAAAYVAALREDDFRKGDAFGGPWECMHPEENHRQNSVYMTTVTTPLAALRRLETDPR